MVRMDDGSLNALRQVVFVGLWVQSSGYWIIAVAATLAWTYTYIGGIGLAYFLLAWPSLVLTLVADVLAYVGFYAIGILLFVLSLYLLMTEHRDALAIATIVFVLSATASLLLEWHVATKPMGISLYLQTVFFPWLRQR